MKTITSITEIVEQSIRQTFESIVLEEIEQIKHQAQEKLDRFIEDQKIQAKKTAQKMTLELMQKMNSSGVSVEFKL